MSVLATRINELKTGIKDIEQMVADRDSTWAKYGDPWVIKKQLDQARAELAEAQAQKDAQNAELGRVLAGQDEFHTECNDLLARNSRQADLIIAMQLEQDSTQKIRDNLRSERDNANKLCEAAAATAYKAGRELDQAKTGLALLRQTRDSIADERDQARARGDLAKRIAKRGQAERDQARAERDQARQSRDINASYKDDYKKRLRSAQKQQDELLQMLDDAGPRVDKANDATNQARIERDEAKAWAQNTMETVERLTHELATMKDCHKELVNRYWNVKRELGEARDALVEHHVEHHRESHHKEETRQPLSKRLLKLEPLSIEEETGE